MYGLVDVDLVHYLDCYDSCILGPSVKIRRSHGKTYSSHNFFGNRISTEWNKLQFVCQDVFLIVDHYMYLDPRLINT